MGKQTPVAVFLAASAIFASNAVHSQAVIEGDLSENDSMGGLKEWTTDQSIEDESTLDDDAQKAKKEAKKKDICIPIGEGENCW